MARYHPQTKKITEKSCYGLFILHALCQIDIQIDCCTWYIMINMHENISYVFFNWFKQNVHIIIISFSLQDVEKYI